VVGGGGGRLSAVTAQGGIVLQAELPRNGEVFSVVTHDCHVHLRRAILERVDAPLHACEHVAHVEDVLLHTGIRLGVARKPGVRRRRALVHTSQCSNFAGMGVLANQTLGLH